MYTQFEEKGKVFTPKITKEPKKVVIQTLNQKLTATIHIQLDNRLLDELNGPNQFLALTDVEIFDSNNNLITKSDFLSINANHITWVLPFEDEILEGKEENQ